MVWTMIRSGISWVLNMKPIQSLTAVVRGPKRKQDEQFPATFPIRKLAAISFFCSIGSS